MVPSRSGMLRSAAATSEALRRGVFGEAVLLASETYRGDITETGRQESELITE